MSLFTFLVFRAGDPACPFLHVAPPAFTFSLVATLFHFFSFARPPSFSPFMCVPLVFPLWHRPCPRPRPLTPIPHPPCFALAFINLTPVRHFLLPAGSIPYLPLFAFTLASSSVPLLWTAITALLSTPPPAWYPGVLPSALAVCALAPTSPLSHLLWLRWVHSLWPRSALLNC